MTPMARRLVPVTALALVCLASWQGLAQSGSKKGTQGPPTGALSCLHESNSKFPRKYLVGLSFSMLNHGRDPGILESELVVFMKDDAGEIFPIVQSQRTYAILCSGADVPSNSLLAVKIITRSSTAMDDLNQALGDPSNELRRWRAVPFRHNPFGLDFRPWPFQPQFPGRMLTELIRDYIRGGEHDLLRNSGKSVDVVIPLMANVGVHWYQAGADRAAGVAPPTTNVAGQQQQPQPSPSENPQVSPPPETPQQPVTPQQKTPFTIGFQDRARWKDVRLNESGRVSTFEFCEDNNIVRNEEDFSYVLQCTPGQDGRIPVKIRGFQLVFVNQAEARQIDTRLAVRGFRTPYPPSWNRAGATAYVEVLQGPLAEVLRSRVSLDQAIPSAFACKDTMGIAVTDIVSQQISFPSPPCLAYHLEFAPGLTDSSAQVENYCMAGPSAPLQIVNGRVTCWRARNQLGTTPLTLKLLGGFRSFPYPLPPEPGTYRVGLDSVIGLLVPVWPYGGGGGSPFDAATLNGEAPRYIAKSVEYLDATGQPVCAPAGLQAQGSGPSMPSLKDAGCQQVPARARIQVARDDQAATNVPLKAFQSSYLDEYELRSVRGPRSQSVDQIKVPLDIRFDDSRARDYTARFRGGRNSPQGVYVFAGNGERCGNWHDGKLVRFNDQFSRQKFTWPQVGAVYDERSAEPRKLLTPCTTAMLAEERTGEVYLTFDLDPIVAGGPRRVIVLANSQSVQRGNISNSLQNGLKAMVDSLNAEHRNRAPLSPISVYSMDNQEKLRPLFTGEDAARKPEAAKARLNDWDIAAPRTPDLTFLKDQPELREADRLILVMDGSLVTEANTGALFALARRLEGEGGGVTFYITGNCGGWPNRNEVRGFDCVQLPQQDLARRFGELVIKRDDRANNNR